MEIETTSRALSGQNTWCDVDADIFFFPWLRMVASELAPKPMVTALVVVINVLRFISHRARPGWPVARLVQKDCPNGPHAQRASRSRDLPFRLLTAASSRGDPLNFLI